jgi:hypothetical protein
MKISAGLDFQKTQHNPKKQENEHESCVRDSFKFHVPLGHWRLWIVWPLLLPNGI